MVISGPQIYLENSTVKHGKLFCEKNKIVEIESNKAQNDMQTLSFPENYHLVPGFIDLHIHGADGKDVMDGTQDALSILCKALASEGTTSFLATTMSATSEEIENALTAVRDYMSHPSAGAKILGVHLEGPFLSPKKVGAQGADKLLAFDVEYIKRWQKCSGNAIKLVTLAPELPGSVSFIEFLTSQKIVSSMGHSDATYAEGVAAIEAGCTHATHLFNAMRGLTQREPGVVTAALLSDKVYAELIVDGIHLHPAIVDLAFRLKSVERCVLVTDAMRAKCMCDGIYDLGGQDVIVENGVARLRDGTLAGSTLKMSNAIQNMLRFTGCDLKDVVKMVSENPAKILGIFASKGSLEIGKDADFVVLDEKFNVVLTVCEGQVIYKYASLSSQVLT